MAEGGDRIDLDVPYWDRKTFIGRLKYFFWVTDSRTLVVTNAQLEAAKDLLTKYRNGEEPEGTTPEEIKYARKLYESAFHPDSGELMNVFGRMSFQVPGGMIITGLLLTFYRSIPAVVFWQWVNQSFNALVNYTNRNADSPITTNQLGVAYCSASTSAVVTALGFKTFLQKNAAPFMQRFVPFIAVAAANCVNIPLMRQTELSDGIVLSDENGNRVTESRVAAAKGISQVVLSRIIMAAPGMLILPFVMNKLEKMYIMRKIPAANLPLQITLVGCFLFFMVPVSCALFPQQCSIKVTTIERLEPENYKKLLDTVGENIPERLYFNKGL